MKVENMSEKFLKVCQIIFGTLIILVLAIPNGIIMIYKILKEK